MRWGIWTLVVAMFVARMSWPGEWRLQMTITLAWLAVGFVASGLLRSLRWRVDPRRTARTFDATYQTDDRLLSAIEGDVATSATPFHAALLRQATALLAQHPSKESAPAPFCLPSFRQVLVVGLLVLLIWLAPALGRGGIGEPNGAGTNDVAADDGAPTDGAGASTDRVDSEGTPSESTWANSTAFSALTDKGTYLLGEEIHLSVRLKTQGDSASSDRLVVVLTADGEHALELPVDWVLPKGVAATLVADFDLKQRLEELGCYHQGLLALDVEVRSATDASVGLRAPQVKIQISENVTNDKTMAQLPAKPEATKDSQPSPQEPRKKEEPPNKPKGKSESDEPQGPEPQPMSDIESNPVVVEPLFTGSERKRREVRVYDREEEEGDNRKKRNPAKPPTIKAPPGALPRSSRKSQLGGGDRRLVRRYFEEMQRRQSNKGGEKR